MAQNDIQRLELAIRSIAKTDVSSSIGGCGSIYIDSTGTHTAPYSAIMAVDGRSAVVSHLGSTSDIEDFDQDITLASGQTLYGDFTRITLTSGKVIAYKKCR